MIMSVKHYFSKNADKRAKFIFNLIAPIYGRLDKKLEAGFYSTVLILNNEINIAGKTILDIGSGTGAWSSSLNKFGPAYIQGIDFSEKMILQAQKNHPELKFNQGNAENLSEFEDNSFDIVTASFVLHGVKKEKRANILNEMNRISIKYIILNDFTGKTPLFIRFLEFMERSDYKNFKQNFCSEFKAKFNNTKKIRARYGTGLYIAQKY